MKARSPPMKREATRSGRPAGALNSLCGHAVAAHELLLIDQLLKHAQGPGLMQPALVATDGGPAADIWER